MEDALELQKELLKQQIQLQESNYKYAVELQKDSNILFRMREHIKELKEKLESLQNKKEAT